MDIHFQIHYMNFGNLVPNANIWNSSSKCQYLVILLQIFIDKVCFKYQGQKEIVILLQILIDKECFKYQGQKEIFA